MYLAKPSLKSGPCSTFDILFSGKRQNVFDLLADLAEVDRLLGDRPRRRVDSGPIGVGAQWVRRNGLFGIPRQVSTITAYERPHRMVRSITGTVLGSVEQVFRETPEGTLVTTSLTTTKVRWFCNCTISQYEKIQQDRVRDIKRTFEDNER